MTFELLHSKNYEYLIDNITVGAPYLIDRIFQLVVIEREYFRSEHF